MEHFYYFRSNVTCAGLGIWNKETRHQTHIVIRGFFVSLGGLTWMTYGAEAAPQP